MKRQRSQRLAVILGLVLSVVAPAVPAVAAVSPEASGAYSASGKEGDGTPLRQSGLRSGNAPRVASVEPAPECPPQLMAKCTFVPAAYVNNNPADPTDYGNRDEASRPADGTKIKGVTVHDIEGTCEEAVEAFQDPMYFVSATFVLCSDGRIIQMVRLKDIAWTAGNWWDNSHFVQIEVAGHASNPFGYTNEVMRSLVGLIKALSRDFGFKISKATVHSHDNVQATRTSGIASMHVDPGPFFNQERLLSELGARVYPSGDLYSPKFVTIAPDYKKNKQKVTGCNVSNEVPPPCVPEGGPFSTNFVYMRTAPSADAPLITDPVTGPGSTEIENRSARAFYGTSFKVIKRKTDATGIWYNVWFGGQSAWFHSPHGARTAVPTKGKCVTPKGTQAVPTFGRPLPEKAEFDAKIAQLNFVPPAGSVPSVSPLAYTIPPGQCYVVIEDNVLPDHYYSWSYGNEFPKFRVEGKTPYVWIWWNGRYAFVKKSDVALAG